MDTTITTLYQKTEVRENVSEAYTELKRSIYEVLKTYSNVHRGSGHHSMVTTRLFEQARNIVLDYLGLRTGNYVVVFCTSRRAQMLTKTLNPSAFSSISAEGIGLPLGVTALAIRHKALPGGIPFQTGGGTAKLISREWVIWGKMPDRLEAGTPAIVNIIAFAKALLILKESGVKKFELPSGEPLSANEILFQDELENFQGKELLHKLKKTLIGDGLQVPTTEGIQTFVNLDNGASTPTFEPVWQAVHKAWLQPEPVKKNIIQQVKSLCSDFLGASPEIYETVFTSNTTEAINLVAESLTKEEHQDVEPVVLNTMLEHNSNELPWRSIQGVSLIRLPVDAEGFLDLQELETLLSDYNQKKKYGKKRIILVAVSGASNVLGVYNNLEKIGETAHRYGARLLVDAAQLVAHRKVAMEKCKTDYFVFSAHKMYAPFGTGVLMVRKGSLSFSVEEMKLIRSSGEENIGGIAALGKALVLLQKIGMDTIQEEEQKLTHFLLSGMKQIQGLEIYGITDENSPRIAQKGSVVVFNLKDHMANQLARKLAEHGGIGVRYGCHCAHIIVKQLLHISPFLEGFQHQIFRLFPKLTPPGVTRVSLGLQNDQKDIDRLIKVLHQISLKSKENTGTASRILSPQQFRQQMDDYLRNASERVYGTNSIDNYLA